MVCSMRALPSVAGASLLSETLVSMIAFLLIGRSPENSRAGEHHIIHCQVAAQRPFAGQRIVADAGQFVDLEGVARQRADEFGGAYELLPAMGAAGQPAENVFRADDRQRPRL